MKVFNIHINFTHFLIIGVLCISCQEVKQDEGLATYPINLKEIKSLDLSEIVEDVRAVELEVTEQSLVSPKFTRILLCNDYIIVAEFHKIVLFNSQGKFIRLIGSNGQGPGQYTFVDNITVDISKELLYVNSDHKLICYDINGVMIQEKTSDRFIPGRYLEYANNELLFISEFIEKESDVSARKRAMLFKINENLQVVDSLEIWRVIYNKGSYITVSFSYADYITHDGTNTYISYGEGNEGSTLRDTLFQVVNNQLQPYLKLKFNKIPNKGISLYNIDKSSRYIFTTTFNKGLNTVLFICYDMLTGKGYCMEEGITDNIHGTGKIFYRPFNNNPDLLYYTHTKKSDVNEEEPNPTLYIGRLKKADNGK